MVPITLTMTLLDFALILGAALALHRIWNYESFTEKAREKIAWFKPLSCSACSPFWIGILCVILWITTPPIVQTAIACYFPIRFATWLYGKVPFPSAHAVPQAASAPSQPASAQPRPQLPPPPAAPRVAERNVIIMTALSDWRSSYSVAQEARNQALSIARANPSWNVEVWTMQTCQPDDAISTVPNIQHRRVIPLVAWQQDMAADGTVSLLKDTIMRELSAYGNKAVDIITHDLLFISWYRAFAAAIHAAATGDNVRWWHFCHSLPGEGTNVPRERCSLPNHTHHRVITNAMHALGKFASYYHIPDHLVEYVPNTRDPRMLGVSRAVETIANNARLWEADVVQIFPACSTRLEAKGATKLISMFAELNLYHDARIVFCNPNARGEKGQDGIRAVRAKAAERGLAASKFFFTSEILPDAAISGIPSSDVMSLMHTYGNVFALPSISEADSLVLLEAALARQYILVNADMPGASATAGQAFVPWGRTSAQGHEIEVASFAASRIKEHLARDESEKQRRRVLYERNLEGIGIRWGRLLTRAGP